MDNSSQELEAKDSEVKDNTVDAVEAESLDSKEIVAIEESSNLPAVDDAIPIESPSIVTEADTSEEISANKGVEDIEFEEVFDLDTIQRKLQASLSGEEPEDISSLEDENALMISESKKSTVSAQQAKAVDPNSKKFVIYIDPENIKYMENLSNAEKKEVINKILREQNKLTKEERERRAKTKYFKHAVLACCTFIVFFPLMFILVNKSLESSITNYQKTKGTFTRLYKQQGKIKMKDSSADPTIKY